MASPSLECPLDLELTSGVNQGKRKLEMADQKAQPKETESSGRSSGFSPVNDDELIGGVIGGSNGANKRRRCTETTNFPMQLIETANNNNNNNNVNVNVNVESSKGYHLAPANPDATSMRTDHKQHQQQICLDSSLASNRAELSIANLEDEIGQLLRNELYGSLPQNDLCSNRDELIGLTARQIRSLCERLIYDRERKLRDEYDRRLATKLAEQYELFARTNYLNTSSEPSRAQTPGTTTSNTALESEPAALASQAQQLLQAAVAAQQHNNSISSNSSNHHLLHQQQASQLAQQQQDPNVATLAASAQLLSALSQFGNPELMKVQSRLLANTLEAANAPGSVQQANELAAQLQQVVAAKSVQVCGNPSSSAASLMLSQALQQQQQQQSESISQPHRANSTNSTSNNNNHDTTIDTNNNYHHNPHLRLDQPPPPPPHQQHRNSHAEMSSSSSSPLLTRHSNHHQHHQQQQASHTALAQQLAAAMAAAAAAAANGPLNLGNPSAAAMAAQLASVARASDSNHAKPGQHPAGSAGSGPHNNNGAGGGPNNPPLVHSIPHPHSHHALSHPTASLLLNSPRYQTIRTKYSTRRYSRRRVGPEEAMADPAIRATAQLKMPVVPKTILIVLKHRLTVQTAITLACSQTGERLRKGAIQKKLEAMFREPGAVDSFLAEWDHPNR